MYGVDVSWSQEESWEGVKFNYLRFYESYVFPFAFFFCQFYHEFNNHITLNVHVHCKLSPHFRNVEKLGGESLSGVSQHFSKCLQKQSEYRDKLF